MGPPGPARLADPAGARTGPARWAQTEVAPGELPVPPGGYEELELGTEADAPVAARPPARSRPAAGGPPPLRTQSQSSLAAARMASAPTFKASSTRGGIPLLPIGIGVVIVLAVAAFALTRGRPAAPPAAPPAEPTAATTGQPAPVTPAVAEPVAAPTAVTVDPPVDRTPAPRERTRNAEREPAARTTHPVPAPPREVARAERVTTARVPPPPAPAPRPEPEPPLPPPPQFVAAPTPPPPAAPAPQASGPGFAREGYQKARQATPGCVVNSLRLPRDIVDVEGETATVKFAVDETGQVSQFSYLSGPTDQRVATAIWSAIQRCEWTPGSTAQGSRIALWVTMPIRFGK